MNKYQRIVFLQGDNAHEALKLLDEVGMIEALNYLKQWDYGEDGELFDERGAGTSDRVLHAGEYLMTWNNGLGYIGLERIIKGDK